MTKKQTKTNEVVNISTNGKITEDMIKFVRENAKTMTYGEMADELGLTSDKVSNILQNYKRKLRSKAGYSGYDKRTYTNAKGKEVIKPDFTKPKSEQAKKVETWIAENLSRPARASMSDALSGDVESILAKL